MRLTNSKTQTILRLWHSNQVHVVWQSNSMPISEHYNGHTIPP